MGHKDEVCIENIEKQRGYISKIGEHYHQRGITPFAYIDTYGCQQNESDSEKLRGMLLDMGFALTKDEFAADVAVINTCAIREHAENRVLGNVGALVHTKREKKSQIIVFCGCLAGVPETVEKVKKSYPHVNLVFPPNKLWMFPELLYKAIIASITNSHRKRVFEEDTNHALIAEGISVHRESSVKAWLPIMYGCNNFCSYCIVPYVRGRERSRRASLIIDEARELVKKGYKDITLLGQNVNSYKQCGFPDLLRRLCGIDGEFLIRFMTSHPKDATNDLFLAMSESDKPARHIHLPFQSGSDKILKRMNRNYTAAQYLEKIAFARELMSDIVITSDVIVGFPGESDKDFEDTLQLVKKAGFEAMFTFIYSKRPGTPAAQYNETISDSVKQERFEILLNLQNDISEQKHASYVGKCIRVLVDDEAPGEEYMLRARTNGGRLVHLKGKPELVGKFTNANITQSNNWSLYGEAVR